MSAFLKLTHHPLFSAFGLFTPTIELGRRVPELRPRCCLPASGQTCYFPNQKSICNFLQTLPTQTKKVLRARREQTDSFFFLLSLLFFFFPTSNPRINPAEQNCTHTHTHFSFRLLQQSVLSSLQQRVHCRSVNEQRLTALSRLSMQHHTNTSCRCFSIFNLIFYLLQTYTLTIRACQVGAINKIVLLSVFVEIE